MSLKSSLDNPLTGEVDKVENFESGSDGSDDEPSCKSKFIRYLGIGLFSIIIVVSIVMVYLSALSFARGIVPLIVKYFIKVPGFIVFSSEVAKNESPQKGTIATIATAYVFGILAFLPLFQLLLNMMIKIFLSFFSSLWKNLDVDYIKGFIEKRVDDDGNLTRLFVQLGLVIALYLLIIVAFCLEFSEHGSIVWKILIIGYSFSFFIFGLGRLFIDCWKYIISSIKGMFGCQTMYDVTFGLGNVLTSEENDYAASSGDETSPSKSCKCCSCECCIIPVEIFDPSEMRTFSDFYKFLVDKDCNIFLSREWTWFFIFPILQLLFIIIYIILAYVALGPFIPTVQLVLLILYLPYSLIFNFGIGFYKGDYYEDKGLLRYGFITGIVLLILTMVISISIIIFGYVWEPPQDHDIIYFDNTTTTNYSRELLPPFCYEKYGNLDISHLSALLMYTRHLKKPNDISNITRYAFEKNVSGINISIAKNYLMNSNAILLNENSDEKTLYLITGGIENIVGWVTELEIIIDSNLPLAIDAIVPLATLVSSLISGVFATLNFMLGILFANFNITDFVSDGIFTFIKDNYNGTLADKKFVVVAQGPSSIYMNNVVKDLYDKVDDITGAFFEWHEFESSVMYQYRSPAKANLEASKNVLKGITNVFSNSSLIGSYSSLMQRNVKYPNVKSINKALNVYDSMCMTMAMCSNNDHWVELCNNVLSENGRDGVVEFKKMHLLVEGEKLTSINMQNV